MVGKLTADGRICAPYERARKDVIKKLPGAHWVPEGRYWSVSIDPAHRDQILAAARQMGLDVAQAWAKPNEMFDPQVALAQSYATAAGAVLYPFQLEGIRWLYPRTRALLADDMGLGKTVQVLLSLPKGARTIVVCPASLKATWADEIRRWRPDLSPVVLNGWGSFRLPEPGEVVISNYDVLPPSCNKHPPSRPRTPTERAWEKPAKEWRLEGCHLVYDEVTAVKNGKAARTRAARALARSAAHVWLCTGTPLLGKPLDLWGVLSCGRLAEVVFDQENSWLAFLHAFRGAKGHFGGYVFGKPVDELPGLLRRVMLRRRKEEVLPQLPAVLVRDLVLDDYSQQLRLQLDALWREWEGYLGSKEGRIGELPPFEKLAEVRAALAAARIPAMLEVVASYEEHEEPLLVFSAHRAPIDALAKRPGWDVIHGEVTPAGRHGVVAAFQAGQLKGVGLTIRAGGFGLTLTRASHVLFVDLSYVPGENAQALDRVRRIGQQASSILCTRMLTDHPLDRRVCQLLFDKQQLIDAAIDGDHGTEHGTRRRP